MIFGGIAGFNLFKPDIINENNYIPPTVITEFKVLNKPFPLTGNQVELKYNQNFFTFEFSGRMLCCIVSLKISSQNFRAKNFNLKNKCLSDIICGIEG